VLGRFEDRLGRALDTWTNDRPFVTLTFAQSLDGSIAQSPRSRTQLSNACSQVLTHYLRARHDAILVGVDTVMVDDPRLSVRLVDGPSPRPVILDSRLRFPPGARLLAGGGAEPVIATTARASRTRERRLRAAGADVLRLPQGKGGRVDLHALLRHLRGANTSSLMVEGGARVITSFLRAGLVDLLVLTVCPRLIGGLRALPRLSPLAQARIPRLVNVHSESLEGDVILIGDFAPARGDAAEVVGPARRDRAA
jgi:3,4-dihydroxy 2-butanone 4-phosphate synthase/GTP cyclohydrolase II